MLGRAGVEAVMLRLPDLTPDAMAKLAAVADLEKGGAGWENEPRIPAGQTGGGQWTTNGGAAAAPKPAERSENATPLSAGSGRRLLLDDGVYRPEINRPFLMQTGGVEEDDEPPFRSNGPPAEVRSLMDVFPGLRDAPILAVPSAPLDGLLGISAPGDAANLTLTMLEYNRLIAQIRAVDPRFVDWEILPDGGFAGLSWQARARLLNNLRIECAVTLYRVRGDIRPLQVETLRFLQGAVDRAYSEAVIRFNAGRLQPRLSPEEAVGNYIDGQVRFELRSFFNGYRVSFGAGSNITINNRDYDTSRSEPSYRVPDARVGDATFDWTLTPKTLSNPQIRGFFNADSQPSTVVIVRPSQFGPNSTYAFTRPAMSSPRR